MDSNRADRCGRVSANAAPASRFHARIFVLAPALALMAGCSMLSQLDKPEIRGVRPRIAGLDWAGIDLEFDLSIFNPYPMPLKAPRFRYDLAIEGARLLSQETPAVASLPARAEGKATLPVRIEFLELLDAVRSLKGANQFAYKLDGALLFNALGAERELPFSRQGQAPVPRPPSFRAIDVKLGEMGLSGLAFDILAEVENPNVFGIDLRDVGYALQLGQSRLGGLQVASNKEIAPGSSGKISIQGKLSTAQALSGLARGLDLNAMQLIPSGKIKTPYGAIDLPERLANPLRSGAGSGFRIE
ncbi:MAG: Late embryogenesis abundant protein [candidate division BRC1 bacterium ADurb.BinA364]|nr:MAG: Late embryogenesis abundant protein [candidate division BRC1 bacterium ADurb.BinA364]